MKPYPSSQLACISPTTCILGNKGHPRDDPSTVAGPMRVSKGSSYLTCSGRKRLQEVLSHFLAAEYVLVPSSLGLWSRFLLLRPGFIIPITFPLYNHLSLCKHQSRTRELRKMRPVTHRRMFFSFSFMQVSSQEPFHYETSLPPLFQRFLIFSSGCKITLNFSVVFQLTYHSPEPSE